MTHPEFSAPWFAYRAEAYCQSFPCFPAARTWESAFSESEPRNASPAKRSFTFPGLTYSSTMPEKPSSWYSRQTGHCMSSNWISVTGALAAPSVVFCWGIPAKRADEPSVVVVVSSSPPPVTTTLTTTSTATTATAPAAAIRRFRLRLPGRRGGGFLGFGGMPPSVCLQRTRSELRVRP